MTLLSKDEQTFGRLGISVLIHRFLLQEEATQMRAALNRGNERGRLAALAHRIGIRISASAAVVSAHIGDIIQGKHISFHGGIERIIADMVSERNAWLVRQGLERADKGEDRIAHVLDSRRQVKPRVQNGID